MSTSLAPEASPVVVVVVVVVVLVVVAAAACVVTVVVMFESPGATVVWPSSFETQLNACTLDAAVKLGKYARLQVCHP